MEAFQQRRAPLRASFTKAADRLDEEAKLPSPNYGHIEELLEQLEEKGRRLREIDSHIEKYIQKGKCTQAEFDAEFEETEQFRDRLSSCRALVKRLFVKRDASDNKGNSGTDKRKYRLPELEFKKFDGNLKDWLSFWGQFRKIHDDPELDGEDKFQYLIQATAENSRARDLVSSFPPNASSYLKAVECLKNRFGNEDMLVEVYVRELLGLVLNNALNPKNKMSVSVLYDKLETQLRSLESLGVATDKYASMLYPLVESCLPAEVLKAWERNRVLSLPSDAQKSDSSPSANNRLSLLMAFLRSEVEGEERVNMARTGFGITPALKKLTMGKNKVEHEDIPTASDLLCANQNPTKPRELNCIFCEKSHPSQDCRQAKNMSLEEKKRLIAEKKSCFVCLKAGHYAGRCRSKVRCPICDRRHHVTMCPQKPSNKCLENTGSDSQLPSVTNEKALANNTSSSNVFLQTLVVQLRSDKSSVTVRALIDTGSQRSYITKEAASQVGCQRLGEQELVHQLFGGLETSRQIHRTYRVRLASMDGSYACNFEALDQEIICGSIPKIQKGPWSNELRNKGIVLSDECGIPDSLCSTAKVHILIGADIAGKLFTGRIHSLASGPVAVETNLGWTLMGKSPEMETDQVMLTTSLLIRESDISDLWQLDRLGITDPVEKKTKEELNNQVLSNFLHTIRKDKDGRYEVTLPWIDGHSQLSSNMKLAEKRLKATQNKLQSTGFLQAYQEVLHEWLLDGIIEEVPEDEHGNIGHYLPHRAVIRENHETTKLRPVFDASANERGSPSLNDCLEKGPNLIEMIPSVLNRFRQQPIGVVSDIKRAFLQIGLQESDRDFVRFLWRENGREDEQKIYRHRRVVFGVASSPFLLGATISHHLNTAPEDLKIVADRLKSSLYVDNLVTSVSDSAELQNLKDQAERLFSLAKFEFHDWVYTYTLPVRKLNQRGVSVLGIIWEPVQDTLSCSVDDLLYIEDSPVTKRKILSVAHRVFDPIGFTCPVTLTPKLLLQECWKLKLKWDEELPPPVVKTFKKWVSELPLLEKVKLPRWIFGASCPPENISLHAFCDASKEAYATCVFARVENENNVHVQLIQARSRVAPLKAVTIPRLELLACCIGARLMDAVKGDLNLREATTFYWSDSSNALCWIKGEDQWGIFVNNRVKEVLTLSKPEEWRHIPGTFNPADLPSRGCTPSRLLDLRWWEGPQWLRLAPEHWPQSEVSYDKEVVDREKKKAVISATCLKGQTPWYCKRFSSFLKIVRLVAWIFRFHTNCKRSPEIRLSGNLSALEVDKAERMLLRIVQTECFDGKDDNRLRDLNPMIDEEGILRVKTRILMRDDEHTFKYPIILPCNHPITVLLISWTHRLLLHAGVQVLMVFLREKFWILRSRRTVRNVVKKCVRCRRYSSKKIEVTPAPLPKDRVSDAAIFQIIGVDLTGPLYLRGGSKCWIVIFTCAVYRAIHFEQVTSLSTEAFMQSLRRFIARRGRPSVIYSDNGTNLVGTNNALKGVDWSVVGMESSIRRIEWRFNPPASPWWGGWWERIFAMLKQLLRRILGRASLDYEELSTILCECEYVINSRPLTYVSDDSEDLAPLTPAMFLQDIPSSEVADMDVLDRSSLNRRACYRQTLKLQLRKRFRDEYLGQLRNPPGTRAKEVHISVGDIVLVEGEQTTKRMDWPLARVLRLFPGKDGHVRVVQLKTKNGQITRPIQRVYPLEIKDEKSQKESSAAQLEQLQKTRSGRVIKTPQRFSY